MKPDSQLRQEIVAEIKSLSGTAKLTWDRIVDAGYSHGAIWHTNKQLGRLIGRAPATAKKAVGGGPPWPRMYGAVALRSGGVSDIPREELNETLSNHRSNLS